MMTIDLILILFVLLLFLPVLVYCVVKLGTYAYHVATFQFHRDYFHKFKELEEMQDGDTQEP